MDLTAYVEKHEFCFDAVLDEQVTNDEVAELPYIQYISWNSLLDIDMLVI